MESLKKVNRILDKPTKIKLLILLVAVIISALIETFTLALLSPFISILLDNSIIFENPVTSWVFDFLKFENTSASIAFFLALFAFAIAVVYILRGIYQFILHYVQVRFMAKKKLAMNMRLLEKLLSYSYLYHTHKNIAELHRIMGSDVGDLYAAISAVMSMLADFFMTAFMLAYLFYESPVMTACILALTLSCVFIYFVVFRDIIKKAGKLNLEANVKKTKIINQLFGGIKEIKVVRRESYFKKSFNKICNILIKSVTKYNSVTILPKMSLDIICFGGAFIILGFFIIGGADISGLVPQLSVFVLAAFRILPAVTRLVNSATSIIYNQAAINAVYFNLFEDKDLAAPVSDAVYELAEAVPPHPGITVLDVSFTYPSTGECVLDKLTFTIPENRSVALVGPSGVGKTTLADIVLGILTPDSGGVFYNGRPIYDNDQWNKTIGYIPQNIYLLDDTILENVTFGIDKGKIDEKKAWRALEQAQLKSFIESLPEGIHTVVGDRGVRLSGGQRQRIGIARAMYEDPPVLVLDEATSSLDTETESAVMDAIIGFHGSKTILIVAHRLTTIEHCDMVYRVENKKILRER
ncbi:MAG: ABC transporter ATP-binding protein/permease [Oscillospiraceae bacterium]|nr:ABC transporter ATP-binding protein/permease [Oscillospiraceae bacterium]